MRFAIAAVLILASQTARAADRCVGDYAEDLSALSPGARELEARTPSYSYAVRTSATYECVSYGSDANLKTSRISVTAHGTAFGYRHVSAGVGGEETLLLTNQHVAEWPAVTDAANVVDGVPTGCKRVSDQLRIVDNDQDDYADDDIALTRVVVDPALDIAVLRAKQNLQIMPWKVGHSSGIGARNAVEVKGFPLGAFRATNIGKVISAYDHDDYGSWDHDDFVVDALLTHGGSGSPVLAVSCKTGEWELVGIFHAHYANANALNVVVAIDQAKDLITTLKRSPPKHGEKTLVLDAAARTRIEHAANASDPPFFSFGALTASVHSRADGVLVFAVYPADFPATTRPVLVIEDVPDPKAFGSIGQVYVAGSDGLQLVTLADADADTQQQVTHALAMLRTDALTTFDYRAAIPGSDKTRDSYEKLSTQKKSMTKLLDGQHDSVQAIIDMSSKLKRSGNGLRLADVESTPLSGPMTTASATAPATIEVTH
jgi:Trypsin-like peptidase domain